MAKGKPYPAGDRDEDEKTTVESPWEDEASTTVEQAELQKRQAAALRQQNTGLTHTGTGLDEPTVDDQHGPALSAITPIRPENNARLIITQGNDAGQELEIRPGKAYTIGRAIDNDVVLTDISVSRKHFDLKFEDGSWVIVDRGSGNGTVVNGNLEDNPFMLASGDVIEIGNTVFRFDQPNAPPRPSKQTYDLAEDEEPSTVAGKPVREMSLAPSPPRERPRTMPPPTPLRPAPVTSPPPATTMPMRPQGGTSPPPAATTPMRPQGHSVPPPLASFSAPQPLPASTLPMPQMANRPPLVGPSAPTMLGDAMGIPTGSEVSIPIGPGGVPTTLTGHNAPQRASFPYPTATEIPPNSVHAQMLQIQSSNRRMDGSTAHVPPIQYDPMQMVAQPQGGYVAPRLSRRTKLLIAGIGLAVLTGIVTAAVVKSDRPTPTAGATKPTATTRMATKPTVEPIDRPTVEPIVSSDVPRPPKDTQDSKDSKDSNNPKATKAELAKQEAAAKAEAARQEAAAKAAAKAEAARQEAAARAEAKAEAARQAAAKAEAAKAEAAARAAAAKAQKEARRDRRTPDRNTEPKREAEPKRVATVDVADAKQKAESLYRERKFNDASKILFAAAKSAAGDEATQLRYSAELYSKFGKVFAKGMAPAEKASAAYDNLQAASNYDGNLSGYFASDIKDRLATVAPKAAISFLTQQEYGKARSALMTAQRLGSSDPNLPVVKQKLEAIAGELYNEAAKEIGSNPGPAKEKLRQVKTMVDPKSPWAVKAQQLLNRN